MRIPDVCFPPGDISLTVEANYKGQLSGQWRFGREEGGLAWL